MLKILATIKSMVLSAALVLTGYTSITAATIATNISEAHAGSSSKRLKNNFKRQQKSLNKAIVATAILGGTGGLLMYNRNRDVIQANPRFIAEQERIQRKRIREQREFNRQRQAMAAQQRYSYHNQAQADYAMQQDRIMYQRIQQQRQQQYYNHQNSYYK